jgi:hypothetical protein
LQETYIANCLKEAFKTNITKNRRQAIVVKIPDWQLLEIPWLKQSYLQPMKTLNQRLAAELRVDVDEIDGVGEALQGQWICSQPLKKCSCRQTLPQHTAWLY